MLEVRGRGLLAGIRITPTVRPFVARLRAEQHLLAQGASENVLRLLPPLIVTEADIEDAVGRLAAAFEALDREAAAAPAATA